MRTVAFQTLGCKVNQYDSQAMLERFEQAGYTRSWLPTSGLTCWSSTPVVTGRASESRQAIRCARAMHPDADIVVAGCLAQRKPAGCWRRARGW